MPELWAEDSIYKTLIMQIIKFGGTSLGSAERMRIAADIVREHKDCIVVCSAMSGMTNALVHITGLWEQKGAPEAIEALQTLRADFYRRIADLLPEENYMPEVAALFDEVISLLKDIPCNESLNHRVIALGEQVTSRVFNSYLVYSGKPSVLLDATGLLHLDATQEPDVEDISRRLQSCADYNSSGVYVTQGFICRDVHGSICTLSRGGSDFTATLLGAASGAQMIEIWTDIDGMHNNDPRFVQGTEPIRELSYTEAAELAYFGAKILHPSCIRPAREKEIPVIIKNTLQRNAPGTTIQSEAPASGIRAIAAKDDIHILRITSGRMFNAYGFLARVFEIFREHKMAVDVVTTSEVSVSVTIGSIAGVLPLMLDLEKLGRVNLETQRTIICVVGDMLRPGHMAGVMQLVKDFDIRMVSLGASSNNITFVLPSLQKANALNALHRLFQPTREKTGSVHAYP